ncbi:MAG: hypothetical protein Q8J88_12585 [Bacteroidales bacterium]|jgi:hypothetical protein|nr:hypothetical protein [Bacteroidales bacterium]
MIDITAIAIVGIIFSTIYGLFFLFVRRRERLTMMERGYDPKAFYNENTTDRFSSLKYGMLFIGVGAGMLFGNILAELTNIDKETALFSMILLLGGIALTLNYFFEKKEKSVK